MIHTYMLCNERALLLKDYNETARRYADIVREMADLAGLGLSTEIEVLRQKCRQAWGACEKVRLALARHEADHCCDRADLFAPFPSAGSELA